MNNNDLNISRFLSVLNNDSLDNLSDAEFRTYVKTQAARFDKPDPIEPPVEITHEQREMIEGILCSAATGEGDCYTEDKFAALIQTPIREKKFTYAQAWAIFHGERIEIR